MDHSFRGADVIIVVAPRRHHAPGPRHANLLAVVALVLGVLVVCAPANPAGATVGTSLQAGQTLAAGHSLTSANGQYELIMQSAGNLVIYEAPQAGIRALWWTPTYAAGSYLLMQSDCNLVMYSPSGWEWQSGTSGAGTGCRAVMQDNGSLVVYDSAGAVWSSDSRQQVLYAGQGLSPDQWISSPNGHYRFIMQSAGNAVLYGATTPVWWTPTYTAGSYLLMQSDCNLVMYAPSGWEWQSGTSGDGSSCYLALTNSGALQIFNSSGPVWGVNTTNASLGQAAVRLASGQVGYTSPYADSFCNKFTQYWGDGSACDAANRSQAWCADFVAWVWRQAGVSFTYGDGASDINALASSFYQWGVANGHWHAAGSGYVPQPGGRGHLRAERGRHLCRPRRPGRLLHQRGRRSQHHRRRFLAGRDRRGDGPGRHDYGQRLGLDQRLCLVLRTLSRSENPVSF